MAQQASDLLKKSSTVLADTGYYNGTEIKNCVDAGMNVLIKKAKANNTTKDNEFRKERFIYNNETDEYLSLIHIFHHTGPFRRAWDICAGVYFGYCIPDRLRLSVGPCGHIH